MYENYLSIVIVISIAGPTGIKVTHVLLQGPYILYVTDLEDRRRLSC